MKRPRKVESVHERGAAIVEFALVAPMLLALLLGMVSSALAYNQKMNLTFGAREGARYGATHARTDQNWATTVAAVVAARTGGGMTAADVCVSLVEGSGAGQHVYDYAARFTTSPSGGACIANDGNTDGAPRVQVTSSDQMTIDVIALRMPVTLKASAVGAFEQ